MPLRETFVVQRFRYIGEVGEVQHGAISTRQLLSVVSSGTISRWVDIGQLHERHRGVYSIGHARLSDEGRLWAAQLATKDGLLDAATAAWAWQILDPHPDPLHIVTATRRRPRDRLTFRTATPLPDAVDLRGLQATSLETTLAQLEPRLRQKAESNAAYAGLLTRTETATESYLEDLFVELVERARVPPYERQRKRGRTRPDFVWPEQRLIVEIDGGRAHDNPYAFHADRRRDAEALTQGWRTVRFTGHQLQNDPDYVIATLRALLLPLGTIA
ncbi:MAG: hypothetical protein QOF76_47 [Solirubrobacteraceae bacterium]|jgi:very-short-patch-repair endonuclease|nr:hypothetical protein [Solirubrobacteraceae bacterium]